MEQLNDVWRSARIKVISDTDGQRFATQVNQALNEGWKKESPAKVVEYFAGDYMSHGYAVILYKEDKEE